MIVQSLDEEIIEYSTPFEKKLLTVDKEKLRKIIMLYLEDQGHKINPKVYENRKELLNKLKIETDWI